jgi:hypothetical protein
MNSYPKVADKLKTVAIERKKRNYEAKQEVIDLLEAVEVKKNVDFFELAGTPLLGKKKSLAKSSTSSEGRGKDTTKEGFMSSIFSQASTSIGDRSKSGATTAADTTSMSARYMELKEEVKQLKSTTLMLSMQADRLIKYLGENKQSKNKLPPLKPKP